MFCEPVGRPRRAASSSSGALRGCFGALQVATAAYSDNGLWYVPTTTEYPKGGYEVSVSWAADRGADGAKRGCALLEAEYTAAIASLLDARKQCPAAMPHFEACIKQPSAMGALLAVDETAILLHPPSTFGRCVNSDGERASAT